MKQYIDKHARSPKEYIYHEVGSTPKGLVVLVQVDGFGREAVFQYVPATIRDRFEEFIPLRKGSFWINVYPGDRCGYRDYGSREQADQCAQKNRIACIEVPWVEGQGLEKKCPTSDGSDCGEWNMTCQGNCK